MAIENHHAVKFGKPSISIRAMASIANCKRLPEASEVNPKAKDTPEARRLGPAIPTILRDG